MLFTGPDDFCRAAGGILFSDKVCRLFERSEFRQTLKKAFRQEKKAASEAEPVNT
jgi:hypothetical protein